MAIVEMAEGGFVNVSQAYECLDEQPNKEDFSLTDEHGRVVKRFARRCDLYFFAAEHDIQIQTVH